MTARMNDSFTGVRVVKAFGKEESENASFSARSRAFGDSQADIGIRSGTVFPIVSLAMWMGSLIIYVLGGKMIIDGSMGFGQLTSLVGYVGMIYGPLEWLTNTVQQFASAMNSANRIFEIIDARSVIQESETPKTIDDFKGRVTFENVNFSYLPNRPVLKNISFEAAPGEHIGIVGPSGAGKSTLLRTLSAQLRPSSGAVLLAGRALSSLGERERARRLALLPTRHPEPEYMSCREAVQSGRYPYTGMLGLLSAEDRAVAENAMRLVGVETLAERDFRALSDGQRLFGIPYSLSSKSLSI